MGGLGGGTAGARDGGIVSGGLGALVGALVGDMVFPAVERALATSENPQARTLSLPVALLASGVAGEISGDVIRKWSGKGKPKEPSR